VTFNQKQYSSKYYYEHRKKILKYKKGYDYKNKKEKSERMKAYYKIHKVKIKNRVASYRKKLKYAVFSHYSQPPCCAKCGLTDIRALSIDHINNDGAHHRKTVLSGSGSGTYCWLIKNNFPPGFQVLCMSCQFIKRETAGWKNEI